MHLLGKICGGAARETPRSVVVWVIAHPGLQYWGGKSGNSGSVHCARCEVHRAVFKCPLERAELLAPTYAVNRNPGVMRPVSTLPAAEALPLWCPYGHRRMEPLCVDDVESIYQNLQTPSPVLVRH